MHAKFLLGSPQPSIGAHEKILTWMDNVKKATSPHFEEATSSSTMLRKAAAANQASERPSSKFKIASKL
nr:unnamed protein product [Digitaria exilis]